LHFVTIIAVASLGNNRAKPFGHVLRRLSKCWADALLRAKERIKIKKI
jgi:hypothetical protein